MSQGKTTPGLLVLGGTGEGYALALALEERFGTRARVVTSFAAAPPSAKTPSLWRAGPFGGADGLASYVRDAGIVAVLVATHPFAAAIARNARLACESRGIPRLTLARPPWERVAADRWVEVDTMAEAARRVPDLGRRVFLASGARSLPAFAAVSGVWFLVRLRQETPLLFPPHDPPHHLVIGVTGKDDLSLMRTHAIDVLVTKASGGSATEGKILAARALGLPVLMVRRPSPEAGETVNTVAAAVAWVEAILARL